MVNKIEDPNTKFEDEEQKKKAEGNYGAAIGVGVAVGAAFGILLDNLALGIAIGLALGAGLGGFAFSKSNKKD
ncbi:glycine zipper family protein [Marinilactibacillus kalidii]|uniref:glycine zipper family protein n=1 Tax=Marinilactibacillus kalidii TaxID=2820274 RepID=UPI001ABDA9C9|nr:glycine zipper family protein [Marinilactibacillus kalidii]